MVTINLNENDTNEIKVELKLKQEIINKHLVFTEISEWVTINIHNFI